MTFLHGTLLGVTHVCMECANVNWPWLRIWTLIFRGMHAFKLQNLLDKAVERKTAP